MTNQTIQRKVDRLGEIKAQMAELQNEYDKILYQLRTNDVDEADGKLFHFKTIEFERRWTNWKALVKHLKVSKRTLAKFVETTVVTRSTVTTR